MVINTSNLICPITAALLSGTSRQNIRSRIKSGALSSVSIDGVPFVVLDDFARIYKLSVEEIVAKMPLLRKNGKTVSQ